MIAAAILTALATSGFWQPGVGSSTYARFESLAACERNRPVVEAAMVAHGYTGVRTVCNEVKERGV